MFVLKDDVLFEYYLFENRFETVFDRKKVKKPVFFTLTIDVIKLVFERKVFRTLSHLLPMYNYCCWRKFVWLHRLNKRKSKMLLNQR